MKVITVVGGKGRSAWVLRHIGQRTPGRVTWSVLFQGGVKLIDSAVSGLRTLGEARRIAEAFAAMGAE